MVAGGVIQRVESRHQAAHASHVVTEKHRNGLGAIIQQVDDAHFSGEEVRV